MPDDEFDRDLASRLRAYESTLPDVGAPVIGPGAGNRRIQRRMAAGGVFAAVAAGGLATLVLLNIPWGKGGDQASNPSPTQAPAGITQLPLDDPRRDCVGNAEELLAVYEISNGEAFWSLFPEAGLAPEMADVDAPLLVTVYDGSYPGAVFGGLRPSVSGEPVPSPSQPAESGTVDVCVETVDGTGGSALLGVYGDISLARSPVADVDTSGGAEPTPSASPPVPSLTASDGTSGMPISWCWDGACVDGALDFEELDRYPGVGSFFSLDSDAVITRLEATAYASADNAYQLEVRDNNEIHVIGPEPRIVLVRAEFEGGGDASYAWRVARQVIVGVGDDHVAITEPLAEVTPPHGPDAATVRLSYTDWETLGIEGVAMFLKATTAQDAVVLDRIVSPVDGEERLPPGQYTLTAYYRACDGSCDLLDPPETFCLIEATLDPNDSLELVINVSGRSCEADPAD